MKDVARVGNHPIHPMLVSLPIGLWIFALITDIVYRVNGREIWASVTYFAIAGGIIGALLAAVPGFIDILALKPSPVRKIAIWHMSINLCAVILFAADLLLRTNVSASIAPFVLTIVGVLFILVSGWLGGQMVYVHGLAVDETLVCGPGEGAHAHR